MPSPELRSDDAVVNLIIDMVEASMAGGFRVRDPWEKFGEIVEPILRAALREGHLEGDAVAGAEDEWQPIADVPPGTDKIIGWCVFPAGAEARMCQRFYRDDRWMAFGIAQNPTHFKPWPAEGPIRALPAKTGGVHGE